jgi:hypothetical protein
MREKAVAWMQEEHHSQCLVPGVTLEATTSHA